MKSKEPKGVGEILESLKTTGELGKAFHHAAILERWGEVAGSKLMAHGRPLGVRDGTLVIEVDSAVWMHKYSYRTSRILERLRVLFGDEGVEEVYLTLVSDESGDNPQDGV